MILVSAMFFPGIILRTKSIASGRRGPGILQPLRDAGVLLRKGSVFSTTTGLIFQIAPVISLATVLCAILVIPFGKQEALIHFEGDFVFFAYILSLGRFFMIIAALDTGSSFEGMGASREAFFAMLIEPAFFILMATFAMFTGYVSFTDIFSNFFITSNHYVLIFSIIGFYLFIQIALVENSRLPVDDPKTHLELTMIHEVMVLDHSGPDFAYILYGAALKLWVMGTLLVNVVLPVRTDSPVLNIVVALGGMLCVAILVGVIESSMARLRLLKVPSMLVGAVILAGLAFVLLLR